LLEQLHLDPNKLRPQRTKRTGKGHFAPGQSGNPGGSPQYREAAESLRIAALEQIRGGKNKGKRKLRRINEKIVELAMRGKPWACAMVHDRLDGKPLQQIDQTTTHEVGDVFIELLRAINAQRGKVIEHEPDRTPADGGMAEVGS